METAFRQDVMAGKVAFVTGGGSGICKGIARSFLAHGASVAIVGRNEERLQSTARELGAETGRRCVAAPADVREPEQVEAAVERAIAELDSIDVVVNGAAGNFLSPAAQLSYNGFRTVVAIDTLGTYNVSKACFDAALKDRGGSILNISATLHYGATPAQTHAAAAKAAVDSLTRSLALEWGPLGIRVNGIAPGPIEDTEGVARLVPDDLKERIEGKIPLRRFGRIDEIASLAVFLSCDAGSLINGATVVADGGAWLAGRALGM